MPRSTSAPTVPKLHLGAASEDRLAALVLDSPLLSSVLPDDQLQQLFTAYNAAVAALAGARSLPAEPDLAAEVDAALRAGETLDPSALVTRVGTVAGVALEKLPGGREQVVTISPRDRVISVLDRLTRSYTHQIVSLVEVYRDDYFTVLNSNLTDILDRAGTVAAALGGIDSAEAAIKADRAAEYAALQSLTAEYQTNRELHASLLRNDSDDAKQFAPRSPGLLRQMFAGLSNVWPSYDADLRNPPRDLTGKPILRGPFEVFAVGTPLHLLSVVRDRARLIPFVGDGTHLVESIAVAPGPSLAELGGNVIDPASARGQYLMNQIRNAGTSRIAGEREEAALQLG